LELCDLTIVDARRRLDAGEFHPIDLVSSCLERIRKTDETLDAWITVDEFDAVRQAREVARSDRGPLWGIPIGVKDIIDVKGLPTTAASRILQNNVAKEDAPVVAALRQAGAVILGKTNTHEFAYGVVTPPTKNPWDVSRIPGGSSGGSGVAVAVSQCLGALGTDTAGSIRIPAALCGIAGLKPRHAALSVAGVIPLSPRFDAVGPMARTAEDLLAMWSALFTGTRYTPIEDGDDSFVLAIPNREAMPDLAPEVEKAYDEALQLLKGLASKAADVVTPNFFDPDLPRRILLMGDAVDVHKERGWWPARAAEYSSDVRRSLEYPETWPGTSSEEYWTGAEGPLDELAGKFSGFLEVADVLATPTVPMVAPTHEEASVPAGDQPRPPIVGQLTRIPAIANVSGLAAVSVLCGFSSDGLPIGLQLIGDDEVKLLRVAALYEREAGFSNKRPPIVGN
jgi:aspartyl-tRNA(Asn)/glutamyl-tRNA(Gln) amidotransferase subunit A